MSKSAMRAHFRHLRFKSFSLIKRAQQAIEIWPFKSLSEISEVHRDSFSQLGSCLGSCLGSVKAHSLTLSYTPGSFWCDSRASSWPAPLQPLCLGREPKAKVAIIDIWWIFFSTKNAAPSGRFLVKVHWMVWVFSSHHQTLLNFAFIWKLIYSIFPWNFTP